MNRSECRFPRKQLKSTTPHSRKNWKCRTVHEIRITINTDCSYIKKRVFVKIPAFFENMNPTFILKSQIAVVVSTPIAFRKVVS